MISTSKAIGGSSVGKKELGEFMSRLATSANTPTQQTISKIREKLELEVQAELEARLTDIFRQIQVHVQTLRSLRRQEALTSAKIKELEQAANDIVNGK